MFLEKYKENLKRRRLVAGSAVLAGFYAFCIVVGAQVSLMHQIDLAVCLLIIPLLVLLYFAIMGCWTIAYSVPWGGVRHSVERPIRSCSLAALIIFVCWFPILLAGYPGFFTYDAGTGWLMQWSQIESGILNAHHPIVHTLFLKYTIELGIALFGSFNAGIFVSVIIQAFTVSLLLCIALFFCVKAGMGKIGFMLSTAFYALNPIIGLFAFCTTKDVFCSALFVAYCAGLMCRFGVHQERRKRNVLWFAYFAILLFLVGILRSNALVAAFIFVPLLMLVIEGGGRKRLFVSSILAVMLCAIWLGPISSFMHVEKSPIGKWNMLCIPEQQIARCLYSDDVSSEDKAEIEQLFPGMKYQENLSDIARGSFVDSSVPGREMLELYLYLGQKYPSVYLKAFLFQTEDMWSPFSVIDCYSEPDSGMSNVFSFAVQEPGTSDSKLPAFAPVLQWISSDADFQRSPLGIIVSIPFSIFILMFALVGAIVARDKTTLLFAIPLAIMALSNVFGPCVLIRYFLYLFYAMPILMYLIGTVGARVALPESSTN